MDGYEILFKNEKVISIKIIIIMMTCKGGGYHYPSEVFFLEDKPSAPDVFNSCWFIFRAHFETSLVMVSYCGYEIWRRK